jgi:hypothetical protein
VTDVNGNVSTCTATITVEDNVAPIALCQDFTIQLDVTGNATASATAANNGSSDACGFTLSLSQTSFVCSEVGANAEVLTVTDVNGNSSTCNTTITVEDNVVPVAICQNVTVQLDATGNGSTTTSAVNNGSSDACGISLALSQTSFVCSEVGANTETLTVTDVNGNISTCNATITVQDNIAPVAICQNVTVQLDASGNGSTTAVLVNNNSSDACGIAGLALSQTAFNCTEVGPNGVTLVVTDVNGNVSTCTATVAVEDNVAPVALCQDVTVQLDATGNGSTTASAVDNGSNDACGIASLALSQTAFVCSEVGANAEVLTVIDVNGNVTTCNTTVTVEDNVAPIALCQAVTVQLDATGNGSTTPAAMDNGSNDACGIQSLALSQTSFVCSEVGANTETLTVTDVNGNSSICSALVFVEDNVAPIALCLDLTVQLDSDGNGSTTANAVDNGSNDACGIAGLSIDQENFDCGHVGANTITLTATDVNGNSSTCASIITVEDNIAPIVYCLDFTLQLQADGTAILDGEDILDDFDEACPIVDGFISQEDFDCSHVGPNIVIVTLEDESGNIGTCSSNVTVEDNVAPIALCQDVTVQLDATGNGSTTATAVDNGSNDACGIASLALSQTSFACSEVGANAEILTVTDVNGNVTTCNTTVTVEDNVAPIALCQNVTVQLDATGNGSTTATAVDNGSNDACGIASLALSQTSFVCSEVGANAEVLTVTDVNGNVTTCNTTVTVEDNIAPIALCQDVTVQLDATGNGSTTATAVDNGSNDACGIASLALSQTSFVCSEVGANAEILTVTDVNGNLTTCNTTVTVEDNVAPIALCQDVTVQLDATGNGSTTTSAVDNGSSDACGISLSLSQTSFVCSEVGANAEVLTVTDVNGNVTTCNTTVTVEDNVAPIALCKDYTINLPRTGNATVAASTIDNGSNDACGIAGIALNPNTFDCTNKGANAVVLTVTDVNGNVSTCGATITVTTDPMVVTELSSPTFACGYNVTCFNAFTGSIALEVEGGCLPYTYSWSGPSGFAASSEDISGLRSGTYNITITDANGDNTTGSITLTQPNPLVVTSLSWTHVTCYGFNDGTFNITAGGGCPPYTYLWTSTTIIGFSSTDQNPTGLAPGGYRCRITDANGCITNSPVRVITQPALLVSTPTSPVNAGGFNISCNGANDGSIDLATTGGTAPYAYNWSGPASTTTTYDTVITPISNAGHIISWTPNSGTIINGNNMIGAADGAGALFNDNGDKVIVMLQHVIPAGTTYTMTWRQTPGQAGTSDMDVHESLNGSSFGSGVHKYTTTETYVSETFTALSDFQYLKLENHANADFEIDAITYTLPTTYDTVITVTVTNNPPFASTSEDISGLAAGEYCVTVTDANSCSLSTCITLTEPPLLTISTCPNQTVAYGYYPQSVANINTTQSGGVGPYNYLWTTGEDVNQITVAPTSTTTYTVSVTDINGCLATASHTVTSVDVRCSSNSTDVTMCDNSNKVKCVKYTDVWKRLADGWKIGACSPALNLNPDACGEPTLLGCACQGGVTSVMLQYFGATPNVTVRVYNKKSGNNNLSELIATYTNQNAGDLMTVTPYNSNYTFGNKMFVQINGTGTIYEIGTDCGTIQAGANIGLFSIAQYTDAFSNTCNGDVISCLCQDNLMLLQVKYMGPSGANINVYDTRSKSTLVEQFINVQNGDTLLVNGSLLGSGKLQGETVFERAGVRDAFVNSDCGAGGLVGRIYGDYLVTGYVDKKNNACNMDAPCPCTEGVYALGMIYNGPANGTLYGFLKSNHQDSLGKFTNLYPGDTVIVSAEYVNRAKLENNTYFRLAGASTDFTIPSRCGTYVIDESFSVMTVFGYIDATGNNCNLEFAPNCPCVGGVKTLTIELNNTEDTLVNNYTINVWANATQTFLIDTFMNVNDGTDMFISAASIPGGEFLNFVYVEIVGVPGNIKIPTECSNNRNIVGETFDKVLVTAMEDSVGNKCVDLSGPNTCRLGYTLMCHTPKHGHGNKGPHTHCIKNKDVQKKLRKNTRPNHAGEWAIGPCAPLREGADVEAAIDERVADGRIELSAFPNPFSEATTIRFRMPEDGNAKLAVYSITGQMIKVLHDGEVTGGKDYKYEFKGNNLAYGMYFYRLETPDKTITNKLVLTK